MPAADLRQRVELDRCPEGITDRAGQQAAQDVAGGVGWRLAEVEPTVKDAVAMTRLLAEYDDAVVERDELRAETRRTHDGMFALLGLVKGVVSAED